MATRTCITAHDLARHFASRGHLYLPAQSASAIALTFGCPPHANRLIGECAFGRPISWRCPSIDTRERGLHLMDAYQRTEPADVHEVEVARQAPGMLGAASFCLRARDAIHGVFDDVTIDTYIHLICAFGIVEANESTKQHNANRLIPVAEASKVCCRARDCLVQLANARTGPLRINVHTSAFTGLRLNCTSTSDSQIIESNAEKQDVRSGSTRRRRCQSANLQLRLFGESDDCSPSFP